MLPASNLAESISDGNLTYIQFKRVVKDHHRNI